MGVQVARETVVACSCSRLACFAMLIYLVLSLKEFLSITYSSIDNDPIALNAGLVFNAIGLKQFHDAIERFLLRSDHIIYLLASEVLTVGWMIWSAYIHDCLMERIHILVFEMNAKLEGLARVDLAVHLERPSRGNCGASLEDLVRSLVWSGYRSHNHQCYENELHSGVKK